MLSFEDLLWFNLGGYLYIVDLLSWVLVFVAWIEGYGSVGLKLL